MTETSLVILIVGIPGAGKSTVAREVAGRFERAACIEGDLVQGHFTVRGLVDPGQPPAEQAHRQMALRWRNCAHLARNFSAEGFTVVVEHAVASLDWIELFLAEVRPAPVSLIVLAPSLEVALARDRARSEKHVAHFFAHMDAEIRRELAGVGYWLDTSTLTVDETVDRLLADGIAAGLIERWSPAPERESEIP